MEMNSTRAATHAFAVILTTTLILAAVLIGVAVAGGNNVLTNSRDNQPALQSTTSQLDSSSSLTSRASVTTSSRTSLTTSTTIDSTSSISTKSASSTISSYTSSNTTTVTTAASTTESKLACTIATPNGQQDWIQRGYNATNANSSPFDLSVNVSTSSLPLYNITQYNDVQIVSQDKRLFSVQFLPSSSRASASIEAFDLENGSLLWQHNFSSPLNGTLFLGAGCLFIDRYAISQSTGTVVWTLPSGSVIEGYSDGYVFASVADSPSFNEITFSQTSPPVFSAVNASTGSVLWKFAGVTSGTGVAVSNGIVYTQGGINNTDRYALIAINETDGKMIWEASSLKVYGLPSFYGGAVYVASSSGDIYAFNASNGEELWKSHVADSLLYVSGGARGVILVATEFYGSVTLYGLNSTTGAQLWTNPSYSIGISQSIAGGEVMVPNGTSVYFVNLRTGTQDGYLNACLQGSLGVCFGSMQAIVAWGDIVILTGTGIMVYPAE